MKSVDPLAGISVFLAIADTLNFSAAARRLDMSRATVGAQLDGLEKRLGVLLFQRTTRSVSLTEAGAAYRDSLSGVLTQIRQAERAANSFQKEVVGRIRIAAPQELASEYMAPVIAEFLAANPAISIELVLSNKTVNLIGEGFDLAIRGTISTEPNLVVRKIGSSPIMVCAAPAYLKRNGLPSSPDQLANHACLHFSELRGGRVWPFTIGKNTVRVPIEPRLEVNDGGSLCRAAIEGAGITLLPGFIVGAAIRAGKLVQLLPEWTIATVPINSVYPSNRHIATKVRSFVSLLKERLSQHPHLT